MRHQRVQISPVQVSARFCVKDSFSAGRAKSEMPAMTSAHCVHVSFLYNIPCTFIDEPS